MVDPLEPGGEFACDASGIPSFSYVHWRMAEAGLDTWFRFRVWDRTSPGAEAFFEWWNEQRALVGSWTGAAAAGGARLVPALP